MNYYIPISYNLNIKDLNKNYIENNTNEIIINNFKLSIDKNNIIYNISSDIKLENLLDFLNNYNNIIIKKIYYFLIIKHLLNKKIYIKKDHFKFSCFEEDFIDLYLKTRDYNLGYNTNVIITDYINYNICLIIINKTIFKHFISIIDKNCIIDCLYEILENNIYVSNKFEDIDIIIIGGIIDNVDIIIKIYNILKNLKLSKFITKTYLFRKKPLNRLKFDSSKNKIKFINNNSYCDCYTYDNLEHINNPNFFSNLNRII